MLWYYKLLNYIKAFRNKFRKTKIKAVYESDLIDLLTSLGVLEHIKNKKYRCLHCNKIITLDNLEVVTRQDKKVLFICSNSSCISKI